MNVKELIEHLQTLDPDKMVVVSGYEGGCDEITNIEEVRINLNVNTSWWDGKHEENKEGECYAVYIG